MGKLNRINWIAFCIFIFCVSRIIMLYQFGLASNILHNHADFFNTMCKWDCKWYLTIINNGYDLHPRITPKIWHGLANWAFFPLYPYIVKYVALLSNASPVATGIILNQIFILLALHVFYLYLKLFFDEFNSRFGVILLAFSPFSIYFSSLYTEALFLLLSVTAFYLMRVNKPYLSAIAGGLLAGTRPVGIMFSVPYLYNSLKKYGIRPKVLIGCIIATSGLLIYMVYLHFHTGDFLAFKHIQQKWGRNGIHWDQLTLQLREMIVSDPYNSFMFLLSCVISIYLLLNKYVEEAVFNLLCILPGVMTGAVMSEGRFTGTLFTFYFAFVLLTRKSNSLKIIIALAFIIFYLSYITYWLAHAKFLI